MSGYVLCISQNVHHQCFSAAESLFKPRNFDPESRTIKKHTRHDDVEMEDTVEKNVAGLAEQIIQEDKAREAQELVRCPC